MSSYATVYLSDGRVVCSFRNEVDQMFFILFTKEDWVEFHGHEALQLTSSQYRNQSIDEAHVMGFRTPVWVLRDRLDVMGVDINSVSSVLSELVVEELETIEFILQDAADTERRELYDLQRLALSRLDWTSWLNQLKEGLRAGHALSRVGAPGALGSPDWLMSLWQDSDVRYVLRALLEALPDDETITLDIANIAEGGWIDPTVDPQSFAGDFVSYASYGGIPPIVLTEGSFDVEVLTAAVRIRRPHLKGFIRFPDFASRPEGGAAALRQTVRAFASAGVPNRIIALFDNDTAARDVVRAIDRTSLPANIVVAHLPELPLAEHYPTEGPQGHRGMDVNGLAASIELFLGADVLTHGESLLPVRWGGFFERLGSYQGEVTEKRTIQEAFRKKVKEADRSAASVAGQDWSGVDLILNHIVDLLTRNERGRVARDLAND